MPLLCGGRRFSVGVKCRKVDMGDDFDIAGKVAVLAVEQLSGASFVTGIVRMVLPPNADDRLRAAIEADASAILDDVQRRLALLESELRREGKSLESPGAVRTARLAHGMGEALGASYSDVKRDAVANASARQFDPRMGEQGARKYWLDRVAALTDLQVWVLQLLREHKALYYVPSGELLLGLEATRCTFPDIDQVSLGTALSALALPDDPAQNPAPLVISAGDGIPVGDYNVTPRVLTPWGTILVKFIAPIDEGQS
jgi:hypothetical protein